MFFFAEIVQAKQFSCDVILHAFVKLRNIFWTWVLLWNARLGEGERHFDWKGWGRKGSTGPRKQGEHIY